MEYKELLQQYRDQIDSLDLEMIYLLSRRLEMVKQIGILKKENNIPALQTDRWNQLVELLKKEAKERNISEDFIEDIWNRIHEEALKIEK